MAQTKIYPKALYMDKKREGAPAFVKGKLSTKWDEFVAWGNANRQYIDSKGYMRFDLLQSDKDGKLYFTVDTYKAGSNDFSGVPFESKKSEDKSLEETANEFQKGKVVYPTEDINPLDIPF